MSYYIHPTLPASGNEKRQTILNVEKLAFVDDQEERELPTGMQITYDFEEYLHDLSNMTALRRSLKIPEMTYHAHYFPQRSYDVQSVIDLIEYARLRWETRWWVNYTSAIVLICIADENLTEDAGWDFYQCGSNMPTRKGFGMPAWWEFCQMGTYIPPDWTLGVGPTGLAIATSPDKKFGMVIGGI